MKTYEQQTLPFGATASTCSPEGSRSCASRSASRANAGVRLTTATSGPQCSELFGLFDRAGSWARTFSESLIGRREWFSSRCALIWRRQDTRCKHTLYQLRASVLPICDTEHGLLPTVVTQGLKVHGKSGSEPLPPALLPTPVVGLRERACEQEPVGWCDCSADARACSADGAVIDADGLRCEKQFVSSQSCEAEERSRPRRHDFASVPNWEGFPTESPICGPDDGLSAGLDGITFPAWCRESIKACGNAIVPQVALRIFETINEYEKL